MPARTAIFLVLTILFWASAFPGIRAAVRWYAPDHLGFFRFLIASAVLAALCVWRPPPRPRRRDVPGLLVLGAVGIAVYNLTLNAGSMIVPSGTAGLLVNTAPIWTAVMAAVTLRERPRWNVWAGLAVAFCGAAVIALQRGGPVGLNRGAGLVLVASLCHAVYITLQKRYVATYGALGITCYAVWAGTAFLALVGAEGLPAAIAAAPPRATAIVVYLGVVPAALAYAFWAHVLARFPASRAVGFLFFVPVGAFLIGWATLGEVPTRWTAAGAVLVLAGVALVHRRGALTSGEPPASIPA